MSIPGAPATILFTDIVGSTERAREIGDRRWHELLSTHNAAIRRLLRLHSGVEINTAGDAFVARFGDPTQAIACAAEIRDAMREIGLPVRIGLHLGQVEGEGRDTVGIALHVGARVVSRAGANEILASSSVRDAVEGDARFKFEDAGSHVLKGLPDDRQLYRLVGVPSADDVVSVYPGFWRRISPRAQRRAVAVAAVSATALLVNLLGNSFAVRRDRDARVQTSSTATRNAADGAEDGSIAVLPFLDLSPGADQKYFSDGLADELLEALSKVPALRVAARTSSFTFRGKDVAVDSIGRALRVAYVLEGSVRKDGDRIRILAQLIDARSGYNRWSESYDRKLKDVFAVQDEITGAIVSALIPALASANTTRPADVPRAGAGTSDLEAYDLYLRGRYYFHERGAENVARSIEYFQQAIARDPTFARAYAGLSLSYAVYPVYVPAAADSMRALHKASALQAVALDSTLSDAQIAIAQVFEDEFRFDEALKRYREALRLDPSNQPGHQAYGFLLLNLGRAAEAIAEERTATRLDPLAKSGGTALAEAFTDARQFDEAERESRRVLAIDAAFPLAFASLGLAQTFAGRADSAVQTLERGVTLAPGLPILKLRLLSAYAAAGRRRDVQNMREQLQHQGGDGTDEIIAAFADYLLGNREPFLRGVSTREGLRKWLALRSTGCNPALDDLWGDARYRAALQGVRMLPCAHADKATASPTL